FRRPTTERFRDRPALRRPAAAHRGPRRMPPPTGGSGVAATRRASKIDTGSRGRLQTALPRSLSCSASCGPATTLAAVKTAIRRDKNYPRKNSSNPKPRHRDLARRALSRSARRWRRSCGLHGRQDAHHKLAERGPRQDGEIIMTKADEDAIREIELRFN